MIYIVNNKFRTAKSQIYLGNVGHIHFLLDEHEASFSDELASETPFIGALELTGMKEQQKADLFAISPEILDVNQVHVSARP